ncbi:MAG: hypothetical protein ACXWNE_10510, partial [Candidatus Binataceae bacterium]
MSPISPSPPKGTILTDEDVNSWDAITLNPTSPDHRWRLYKAPGNGESGIDSDTGSTNNVIGGSVGAGNRIAFSPSPYAGVRVRTGTLNNRIT